MSAETGSTTKSIQQQLNGFIPEAGIILGTGLGGLVRDIDVVCSIPYGQIPGFPESTVEGHKGMLIFGMLGGKRVMAMQGRFHYYEGYTMKQIGFPVRIMHALGVTTLIVSNACGGMNPAYGVGDIMVINDHINFFPDNPLIGPNNDAEGPRFVDMSETYSRRLIRLAHEVAGKHGIVTREGVYVGLTGPCFETPAEYRFLWRMGADVVGMSTVPEVIVAKHSGMEVFGISVVTDLGVEGRIEKVSHEEVLHAAGAAEPRMAAIVRGLLEVM